MARAKNHDNTGLPDGFSYLEPPRTPQQQADELLRVHQLSRHFAEAILRDRTEVLRDYEDTIAFERYLAELEWDRS
jgi:hypothetical protein